MKKQTTRLIGAFALTTFFLLTAFHYKGGPTVIIDKYGRSVSCDSNLKKASGSITGYTQSAPDQVSGGTCNGCHSGGSATPVPTITFSPALGANNTYTPGTAYTVNYTVTGYPKFGFDLEMNNGNTTSSGTAGTLASGANSRYTAGTQANITHSKAIATGTNATFTWTAPAVGTTVYLFSNALGVNGTGGTGGDKEVFKNIVLTPAIATSISMTCPSNQTINSSTSTVVPDLTATTTASSTCGTGSISKSQSPAAGTPLALGSNVITVTATDGCSNTKTCTSTITYVFNTGVITMTCPSNQTINSSTSTVVPNLTTSTTASTNCPGGVVTKTQSPLAGTPLALGNNIITVSATDACGDTKTCTSTVNYVFNTGAITINCPSNQTINSSTSTVVPDLTATTTASTNCPEGVVTKTQSPIAGTPLSLGNNVITVTATDICGDSKTCTSTVNYVFNTGSISMTCPVNQTINSSSSTVVPDLTTSTTASTNCPNPTVTKTQSPAAGTPLSLGDNVITVTAKDACGDSSKCTSTINYVFNTGSITMSCPSNQTIYSSTSTVVPDLTSTTTASTNCPGGVVSITQSPLAGTSLTSGNNVITITATDVCGDSKTCTTTINHIINTGTLSLTCPGNQTIYATTRTTVPDLTATAISSTTCPGGVVNLTQSPLAATNLISGNNVITITATDNCSNTKTCTSTINYVINTGALVLTCSGNQSITSSVRTTVPDLTASSNVTTSCGGNITKTQSPLAGTPLTPGNNVITITATDNCSNSQSCTTIIDYTVNTGVISLNCPSNQTITSSVSIVVPDLVSTTTASTSCPLVGSITKTQSPVAGTPLTPGNNVITISATDACNDTQSCTSTINYVINTGVLSLSCPANQTITSSVRTTVPDLTSSTVASSTCPGGSVTLTQSPAAGTPLNAGNNVISIKAKDNCNDSSICTSTINYVINTGVLTLHCPPNQTITSNTQTTVPDLTTSAGASTTCPLVGAITKTQSPAAGTPLTPGNNTIIITATDACNDIQTCYVMINYVINQGVLSLACPKDQTIIASKASNLVPNIASGVTSQTTCPNGLVSISQYPPAGAALMNGNNIVTVTATDFCQNNITCHTTIIYLNDLGLNSLESTTGLEIYPNPTKDKLTINYILNSESTVNGDIYDMNGKLISRLIQEENGIGQYSKNLNLGSIESGIYLIKLTINGAEIHKKLIIE